MAELLDVIQQCECTSTHHKLAIDALRHLQCDNANAWRNLFLHYFDVYIDGSKAPDKKFRDFRNHVLHVGENYWGGAVEAAKKWYAETVTMLSQKQWSKAIYAAGVLSHYYTDPLQPLHTAQSEQEGVVHRAMEWSITKSYHSLREGLVRDWGGYPDVEAPAGGDWLEQMVVAGAEIAHPHYQMLIDHYDLKRGVKDPPAGLDEPSRECLARLLGHASVGFARILEKAFQEAAVKPPGGSASLIGYLARLTTPISWTVRKLTDMASRRQVRAIYDEVQKTGKAVKSLPVDERMVRRLHADEILQVPLADLDEQAIEPTGTKHEPPESSSESPSRARKPAPKRETDDSQQERRGFGEKRRLKPAVMRTPEGEGQESPETDSSNKPNLRFYLSRDDDVVDAPSIGPKTARRLKAVGVHTVKDLLEADPDKTASQLKRGYMNADVLRQWQAQAKLACRIPNLRGHDAQLLVGCELTDPEEIELFEPNELLDLVLPYAGSEEGKRILRNMRSPDLEEVSNWIRWSSDARSLRAA